MIDRSTARAIAAGLTQTGLVRRPLVASTFTSASSRFATRGVILNNIIFEEIEIVGTPGGSSEPEDPKVCPVEPEESKPEGDTGGGGGDEEEECPGEDIDVGGGDNVA